MAWPTPQDFNEAIQNPMLAFTDGELQTGRPDLTPLGLPRPITGGFASVYRLQCGQANWAVKCFLRQFDDQQDRYTAIGARLDQVRLPYTVGFSFLNRGIRVSSAWYPILKMEWVQGEPLNSYIQNHLGHPQTLRTLAARWVQMITQLQQASIAHGDLQHGNVFVINGDLRLIDYDGMYVPALAGQGSHEVGHRNYQHPLRTQDDFGPYLDNFSAWAIYVSLIALTVDPGLWDQFGGGDESLLFRREDFQRPESSDLLRALEKCTDIRIRSVATLFKSILNFKPQQVPPLDGAPVLLLDSNWMVDHMETGKAGALTNLPPEGRAGWEEAPTTLPDPSWISDFVAPNGGLQPSVSFRNSVFPERCVLVASAIAALLLFFVIPVGALAANLRGPLILLAALVNFVFWVYRYRSEPSVAESAAPKSNVKAINDQIWAVGEEIEARKREKTSVRNRGAGEREKIMKDQRKTVEAMQKKEDIASQETFRCALAAINARRRAFRRQEADALEKIPNDSEAKATAFDCRITAIEQDEAAELENALRVQQEQHISTFLRHFTLNRASIPDVGPAIKSRLKAAGFHTAADINPYRVQLVQGIGLARVESLAEWKRTIESQARASMPQAIPQREMVVIQAKRQAQRRVLEDERDLEEQRRKDQENAIRAGRQRSLEQLDREESDANANRRREHEEIVIRYDLQCRAFQDTLSKLADETNSKIQEIDDKIVEVKKRLYPLYWDKGKMERQLKTFKRIRFPYFVKRVFFGS